MGRSTIAVDFDGVLHSYTSGWKGPHVISDPPVRGAIEWLWNLYQRFDVVIVSSRARTWRGRRAIRCWLRDHAGNLWPEQCSFTRGLIDIPVTNRKVPALVYIDDRAFRFEGEFPTPIELAGMKPWNRKARSAAGSTDR